MLKGGGVGQRTGGEGKQREAEGGRGRRRMTEEKVQYKV